MLVYNSTINMCRENSFTIEIRVMGGGWVIDLCDCRVSSLALLREGLKKRKNVDLSTYASDPSTHPPNVDKNK